MHVKGTRYMFAPLNKGSWFACPSLDRWVQGFLKSLHGLWTAQVLSEGQYSDSQSSHAHLHTHYSVCLDLKMSEENISSKCSIEIVPRQNLQNAEKHSPTPSLSMPSQAETSTTELWGITDPINAAWLLICLWQNAYRNLLLSDWWSSDHFE